MGLFDGLFDSPNLRPAMQTQRKAIDLSKSGTKLGEEYIREGVDDAKPYLKDVVDLWSDYGGQQQAGYDMYQNALGLNGQEGYDAALGAYHQSPGFQFALDQANQNVLRNQAATGGVLSGQTGIDLSERARQLQNLDFGGWLDRLKGFDPKVALTGQSAGLTNLGNLFSREGELLANQRMRGTQLTSDNMNNLAGTQGQQAVYDHNASMQPWNMALGLLGGLGGFMGA